MAKQKALQKREPKEAAIFAGAKRLMEKPQTPQAARERQLILLTAKVLGVSPFGVNILGGMPYINKLGLAQKAKQYKPEVQFKYNWIEFAKDDTQKAICQCKLVLDDKDLTDWITGECSPSTQKMGTLKGYQNHMAQTRAKNRAILEAFGVEIHEEMMANIEKLAKQGEITPKEREIAVEKAGGAISASAEEIQEEKPQKLIPDENNQNIEALKALAREHGAREGEEKKFLEEKVGHSINFISPTAKYVQLIKAQLLNATVKNK